MTQKIFVSALVAGAVAGLLAAALQLGFVIPLLLEGELYETGARLHYSDGFAESEIGSPRFGWDLSRHGLTVAFNLIAWIGFALILTGAMAIGAQRGLYITAGRGAIWGMMGFFAVHLAPAAGLPPELPGTIGAEVGSRYLWWIATILATTVALAVVAFRPGIASLAVASVLLVAPHLFGAPQLDMYFGVAPPELAAQFVARTLAVVAVVWVVLGSTAGWMWVRRWT